MCNNAPNISFTAIYIFNSLLMCAVNMLAVSYMYVIVLCHKSTVTASMILFPVMSVCMIILVMRAFIYKEMWLFILNLYVFMYTNIIYMDIKLYKKGKWKFWLSV